ncbi:MAG: hypothetical protein ACI8UD_000678 [Planctomycetota bacterium]
MRSGPGISASLIAACLLTGCATQPPRGISPASEPSPLTHSAGHVLRIGLEFLPPDERFPDEADVRAEPRIASNPTSLASEQAVRPVALRFDEPSRAPRLSAIDFESIDDPIARETMHFCSDLIQADRQRVRREVGIPFFGFRDDVMELAPLLTSERRQREEHEQWSQQHGPRLLKRPLRQLAKRLPLARDFEIALEDFRSDHVPLTEPYRQAHGDRRKLGRMSLRLRTRDFGDPMELVYIHHSGVRIGSSQEQGKLSLDFNLSENLNFTLRARTNYATGESGIRTDLIYRTSENMSLHLAAGDDMNFLSTSSLYSLFESPMDGSPGLLLYAVHTF